MGYRHGVRIGRKHLRNGGPLETMGSVGLADLHFPGIVQELAAITGTRFVMAPVRLWGGFSILADIAWATGAYLRVPPADRTDAEYDLVIMTALWCGSIDRNIVDGAAGSMLPSWKEGEYFGKRLLSHLALSSGIRFGDVEPMMDLGAFTPLARIVPFMEGLRAEVRARIIGTGKPTYEQLYDQSQDKRRAAKMREIASTYYLAKSRHA
jgi:hypothetical protein